METKRTLKKVGGSVMLPIPPEMLRELGLAADQEVSVTSEDGMVKIKPSVPRPSPEAVEFMAQFTEEYDEAMRNLAQR